MGANVFLWLHAKTQLVATAAASCADVQAEIEARASGLNGWVDPHNGGNYTIITRTHTADGNVQIWTNRTTNPETSIGGRIYTDKQVFTLVGHSGHCSIEACSESQGMSYKDFSTNYCDMKILFCGTADGCVAALNDFHSTEE